jgi:hypothetical protein
MNKGSIVFKIFLSYCILSSFLIARDNPFFPLEGSTDLSKTSNKIKRYKPLKRATITLPDTARVLKKVTFSYQNLDGSISEKSLNLENSIDWHLPLFVSQYYSDSLVKRNASSKKKKILNKISIVKNDIDNKNKKSVRNSQKRNFKEIFNYRFIRFDQNKHLIKIKTDDELIRKFLLVNPHRVVMDFKRDAAFRTKSKKLDNVPFKEIRLGNHDGYYRVVITLDGRYRFKIDETSSGQLLEVY